MAGENDQIKAGALRLTLGSGFAAFVACGIVVFNDSFETIFGGDSLTGAALADAKIRVLVPVIIGFALIAVGDQIARAWTTAAATNAKARKDAAGVRAAVNEAAGRGYVLATAPDGLTATRTDGVDVNGFTVGAMRFPISAPDKTEYLLVKPGVTQDWVGGEHLQLSTSAA